MHVRGGCTDLVFIRWEGIDEATTGFVMEVSRHGLADDEERPTVGIGEVLLTNDDIIDRLKVSLRIRVGDLLVDIVNPVVVMKVHHCLLDGGEEACNVDRAVALAQGVEGSLELGVGCLASNGERDTTRVYIGSCWVVDCSRHNMPGDVVKPQQSHLGGGIGGAMIIDSDVISNARIVAEQSNRTVNLVVSRCSSRWHPDVLQCTRSRVASA